VLVQNLFSLECEHQYGIVQAACSRCLLRVLLARAGMSDNSHQGREGSDEYVPSLGCFRSALLDPWCGRWHGLPR
jgi:hypothetical protein